MCRNAEQPGSSGYGSGPQQYSPIGSVEDEADGLDDFRKYYLQLDEKVGHSTYQPVAAWRLGGRTS